MFFWLAAKKFCVTHIEELCSNPVSMNSTEQIQNIIIFLQRIEGFSDQVDQFLQILSLVQPKDAIPFVLTPLLSDEMREENFLRFESFLLIAFFFSSYFVLKFLAFLCCRNVDLFFEGKENEFDVLLAEMEKEMSTGDILKELGFGCTFDASHCKDILSHFLPLTESAISKIVGAIACNHAGLEDSQSTYSNFGLALGCNIPTDLPQLSSWNIDILVKTIKQLVSLHVLLLFSSFPSMLLLLIFTKGNVLCNDTHKLCTGSWYQLDSSDGVYGS